MKSSTPVKVLKAVLIVALGFGVYFTERAIRSKSIESRNEARRSLKEDAMTNAELVSYLEESSKSSKSDSEAVMEKTKTSDLPTYIIEVKPKGFLYNQKRQEIERFEKHFQEVNVTRWQYPDFVRVPLSSLGVVFYNGQRFYRQGSSNPPEFGKNSTDAETRAASGLDCKRKTDGSSNSGSKDKSDDTGMINPRNGALQQPQPPVGCCNGVPYNSSKRCCCRRASFDKETKFCCAIDGCGDFKIMNRDTPGAIESCIALEGIVVQEYGYHENIKEFPNFLAKRDPPRRS